MAEALKPDIRELVGIAVNTSALDAARDARAALDRSLPSAPQAIVLYADWLVQRRLFADLAERRMLLERFSARVLHEWLSDRCVICGGSGQLEITSTGALVRARGRGQRNARFTACRTKSGTGCHGTGRAFPSHTARARWLELTHVEYDEQRWGQRFNAAITWLEHRIAGRLRRPLTRQLERRTKRT
jgi:hypothetical protein